MENEKISADLLRDLVNDEAIREQRAILDRAFACGEFDFARDLANILQSNLDKRMDLLNQLNDYVQLRLALAELALTKTPLN